MSTDVTPTLSVAVQVMLCAEPAVQFSPPLGALTVTVGGVTSGPEAPRVMLAMKVPQLALAPDGALAYSLANQNVPSMGSTVVPLKSPARNGEASNDALYAAWPALATTGVCIVFAGSLADRPVTYIDMYSLDDDSMNVIPRSPLGAIAIDGK